MELSGFFRSFTESDPSPVVMIDLDYNIVYMNQCAINKYEQFGGNDMVGHSLLCYMDEETKTKINMVVEWFKESPDNNNIFAFHSEEDNKDVYICALRDTENRLIGCCSRHNYRNQETSQPYGSI